MLGLGLAFGVGAGTYAGIDTYNTTQGTTGDKLNAAGSSGSNYLTYGALGAAGALTVAAYHPKMIYRPAKYAASKIPGSLASYGRSISGSYSKGSKESIRKAGSLDPLEVQVERNTKATSLLSKHVNAADFSAKANKAYDSELSNIMGHRFAGFRGGISRVAERPFLMAGVGAAVGAAVGHSLNKEDPSRGAKTGAVIGGGSGLVLAGAIKTSRIWSGLNPLSKIGVIGAVSTAVFAGTVMATNPKYAYIDRAEREDNGLRSRMDSIGATGDIVLGLHNQR
jgi:hypothetical protein